MSGKSFVEAYAVLGRRKLLTHQSSWFANDGDRPQESERLDTIEIAEDSRSILLGFTGPGRQRRQETLALP
jgi:hypothetical protein